MSTFNFIAFNASQGLQEHHTHTHTCKCRQYLLGTIISPVSFHINWDEGESAWAYPAGRGDPASRTPLSTLAELGSLGCAGIKVLRTALEIHPIKHQPDTSSQNFMDSDGTFVHWYHKLSHYGIHLATHLFARALAYPTVNHTIGQQNEEHHRKKRKQHLCMFEDL